jgi:hypothetical protein
MVIAALSIARPLIKELTDRPFSGSVLGRFDRACNLVDREGRIIALTLPEIGNGPFSIVIAGDPSLFSRFSVGQSGFADQHGLTVGNRRINLRAAKIWEPKLACPTQPLKISSAIASIIKPYAGWSHLAEVNSFANSASRLAGAAAQLNQALIEHERYEKGEGYESSDRDERVKKVVRAVGQLAGLGSGLTPAGDDYIVGVMVALWLTGRNEMLPEMAGVAVAKTTALSAAFLRAAAQGEFMEPWHALVQTLFAGESEAFSQAIKRVAQFGASSGLDALAGFTTTLLSLVSEPCLISIH